MISTSGRWAAMNKQEYFIDDRGIVPDDIKQMSQEQLQAEINKFEKELKEKKKQKICNKS